ncbi:hypothetical protein RQP53_23335 [Paucibacter sp. APW11]|uniref:Peptidase M48 domain-containing protein n=1 Tax=Roseateles aquae TaxID=3077235 RepID=A0ABU3PJC0_9BURK|nr:hypothetical protein [Paucibacter sp. APW11]MDT9002233.1 hypothetical protein [Paucibacter sp. APW11]
MASATLRHLVDLALPKPCEFGDENFAGDPLVREFCDRLAQAHDLNLHFFVAWACPPDVTIVRSAAGSAIIRSERLDTLLIEYFNLQSVHSKWSDDLAREVTTSAVLRWMSELLIGYRHSGLALLAQRLRPPLPGLRLTSPFRDQTLASVPELERVALQCACLAHEVGHILNPRRPGVTVDESVDGLPLAAHIAWGDQACGYSEETLSALQQHWRQHLNGPALLSEVEADLFAFSSVVEFLCNALSYTLEDSIRAALRAFEAQLFVCACKNTCSLLTTSVLRGTSKGDFVIEDYLVGAQYLARARALVRRAGIVWAIAEQPDASPGTRDFNSYVRRIDSMIVAVQPFTALAAETLTHHAHMLFEQAHFLSQQRDGAWLAAEIANLENSSDLRVELFEMLVAFGCPGSVNVVEYLRSMQMSAQAL